MRYRKLLKTIIALAFYILILLGVFSLLAMLVSQLTGKNFLDVFFIIGLISTVLGVMMSIQGNASSMKNYSGGNPAQFLADIESLKIERNLTGYYKNFTKELVWNKSNFGFKLVSTGVISILISYFYT